MVQTKYYCFTINNYTANEVAQLEALGASNDINYLIYGFEEGEQGTPHIQGYVILANRKRPTAVKELVGQRAHIEAARGSPSANRDYCSKDGSFQEFGEFPTVTQGKRSDLEDFKNWVTTTELYPSDKRIAEKFPALYVRYPRLILLRDLLRPAPPLEEGDYGDGGEKTHWQLELAERIKEEPEDDRAIEFWIDEDGGKGKTWFIRKYLTENDDGQVLGIGKRDDLAHAIDETKRVFFINVPREQMQYLQYSTLESIKDRLIFSPKYTSRTKRLLHNPHVIVFCNEQPDYAKLTEDRYYTHQM